MFHLQPSTVSQTVEACLKIREQAVWETKSTAPLEIGMGAYAIGTYQVAH
ncbi:TPA: hypothetical protein ACGORS_002248 [Streptococcus suis]